ncbi:MAG: autotransporter assembly complex family protein [Moraxellaceae bacterium]|nr:autotransporter assembly complex family protein [Moraxellaceae bacterium]
MGAVHAADAKIEVKGGTAELRENVVAYLGEVSEEELRRWRDTRVRVQESVRDAMAAMGYYDATAKIETTAGRLYIELQPGSPVRVRQLQLRFEGEAGNDIAFTALRESLPLKEGDVLHHGHYDSTKAAVQALALERGYFDGKWARAEVDVDRRQHVADVHLVYSSGPRHHFGPVTFVGPEGEPQTLLRPEVAASLVPFAEGEPFEAARMIRLNKSLLDTRYFSSVRVRQITEPEGDAAASDTVVPVQVIVSTAQANDVDLGIGYSTDVQTRISAAWRRPLINDRGHGVTANTELSQVRRSFDATYKIPWRHPLEDVLKYIYGVQREEVEDVVTYKTVVGIQREMQKEQDWKRTYSLRWNRESFERPDGVDGKSDLLLPGIGLDRVRSKGGVDPHWGDRQYYQVELASSQFLSDADFVSLRAGFRLLRTVYDRHQFILRTDGGAILTDNFDQVPLTMRFFAGGDQSVRGYDYKSLSPVDASGIAVGARNLATASAEYDYTFYPRWRVALFVDAGNAFDSVSEGIKTGAGTGIRWVSPVGPIRLDFAWSVSEPDPSLRVHFSMGASL